MPPNRRLLLLCLAASAAAAAAALLQRARHRRRLALQRALKLAAAAKTKSEARQRVSALLPPEPDRQAVLALPYATLKARLAAGDLPAAVVLAVFQTRALEIDRELNCVNEALPGALERARTLDSSSERHHLHGLPISVKEGLPIAGWDVTTGNTTAAMAPKARSAAVLRALEAAGAVLFVRTNMAQGGRGIDCQNALFGETVHPQDPSRSPGGSSGGEAALLAAGGSPVGLGTDIGGSIRIPASLCGIFGFKPTAARVSQRDTSSSALSRLRIVDKSIGPLARDLEAVIDVTRVLCGPATFELDPRVPPLPFDEAALSDSAPLLIGYYAELDDPCLMPPTPAVRRAVEEAAAALAARGHTLVPWQPPQAARLTAVTMQAFATDGGRGFMRSTARELLTPDLIARRRFLGLGRTARSLLARVLALQSPLEARHVLASRGFRSGDHLWQWCGQADAARLEFQEAWESAGLDGLLCPVQPYGGALPRGETFPLRLGGLYASIFNFLDYPAGAVPVTKVTAEDVASLKDYPAHDPVLRRMTAAQSGAEGLPVGLQVVAPPWRDEVCLRLMRELRDAL